MAGLAFSYASGRLHPDAAARFDKQRRERRHLGRAPTSRALLPVDPEARLASCKTPPRTALGLLGADTGVEDGSRRGFPPQRRALGDVSAETVSQSVRGQTGHVVMRASAKRGRTWGRCERVRLPRIPCRRGTYSGMRLAVPAWPSTLQQTTRQQDNNMIVLSTLLALAPLALASPLTLTRRDTNVQIHPNGDQSLCLQFVAGPNGAKNPSQVTNDSPLTIGSCSTANSFNNFDISFGDQLGIKLTGSNMVGGHSHDPGGCPAYGATRSASTPGPTRGTTVSSSCTHATRVSCLLRSRPRRVAPSRRFACSAPDCPSR